jgi:hypothetical protein
MEKRRPILTRAKLGHMDLVTTRIKSLAVDLIAIGSHRQEGGDILFLRVGTSHIEDNFFGRTSVGDIEVGDLDVGVGHAQSETIGAQGVGRQSLGYHTQAQESPDGLPHFRQSTGRDELSARTSTMDRKWRMERKGGSIVYELTGSTCRRRGDNRERQIRVRERERERCKKRVWYMARNDFEKSKDERSNRLKRAESPLKRKSRSALGTPLNKADWPVAFQKV